MVRVTEDGWNVYIHNTADRNAWAPWTDREDPTTPVVFDTATAVAWLNGLDDDATVTFDVDAARTKYLDAVEVEVKKAQDKLNQILKLRDFEFLTS